MDPVERRELFKGIKKGNTDLQNLDIFFANIIRMRGSIGQRRTKERLRELLGYCDEVLTEAYTKKRRDHFEQRKRIILQNMGQLRSVK